MLHLIAHHGMARGTTQSVCLLHLELHRLSNIYLLMCVFDSSLRQTCVYIRTYTYLLRTYVCDSLLYHSRMCNKQEPFTSYNTFSSARLFCILHSVTYDSGPKHISHGCMDILFIPHQAQCRMSTILTGLRREAIGTSGQLATLCLLLVRDVKSLPPSLNMSDQQ